MNALMHVKGYAAPETKAAVERTRMLIEQAEMLGEPPEDPLLLYSVLYGLWVVNQVAFNGDLIRELATEFLTLAEKQKATIPLMIGHRLMGSSLLFTGDIVESRASFDRAVAHYDPDKHRPLATRFGQDIRVSALTYRALCLWVLGYPEAALADTERALQEARSIGQATTLMFTLYHGDMVHIFCGDYAATIARGHERIALAEEKGALYWKSLVMATQGVVFVGTARTSQGIGLLTAGITDCRSTGTMIYVPLFLSYLANAHAEAGQSDDAWRYIGEATTAVERTKENVWKAEIHRMAGEIALKSSEPYTANAQTYFERALDVARKQQAKSWELRAAMSMARLWRDQGKRDEARDLLAPVYGWFTEGFETRDLKEARALLDELGA
jgi:predicted ATPase